MRSPAVQRERHCVAVLRQRHAAWDDHADQRTSTAWRRSATCRINTAGTGNVLRGTSGGLTAGDSNSFAINAAAATTSFRAATDRRDGRRPDRPDVTVQLAATNSAMTSASRDCLTSRTLITGTGPLQGP